MSADEGQQPHSEKSEAAPLLPQDDRSGAANPAAPQLTPEQNAAWMAAAQQHHAYYYGEQSPYRIAAEQQQQQQQQQQQLQPIPVPYFYPGYMPQEYTTLDPSQQQQQQQPAPVNGQPFHPAQAYGFQASGVVPEQMPMSVPMPMLSQAQRPPRSQRRAFGAPPHGIDQHPEAADTQGRKNASGKQVYASIATDHQPLLPQINSEDSEGTFSGIGGGNGNSNSNGNYGSTNETTAQAPKIYNAPPRASNKSSVSDKARLSGLPRTNSMGDLKNDPAPSGSSIRTNHRRINSEGPQRFPHRRLGSGDELPPTHRRRNSARGRSFSAGNVKRPTHRRADSLSSVLSNVSATGSVVSNIAKSDFFGGVDEQGRVQLHYPFEAIRLDMMDPEDPNFLMGHLYGDGKMRDYDLFEEYHRVTDGLLVPRWESSMDRPFNPCDCKCNNCSACSGKQKLLPDPSYTMMVDNNVYKRVMAEISEAHSMPCGLFFCGHHEDVAHPSILIAVVLVTILFACLIFMAIFTGDM